MPNIFFNKILIFQNKNNRISSFLVNHFTIQTDIIRYNFTKLSSYENRQ